MPLSSFGRLTLLGKGSYGKVYRAHRKDDSIEYAIKELNIAHMNKKEREESANEVRILASITHANIIRYYEAFVERDHLYIVTELAASDLNAAIENKKRTGARISEDTIWVYFIQMCIGLKYLHDQDIMHRDMKPQNVFITSDHAIKIGDLGCSKLMKGGIAQTQCGTPYYMSPELWKNQPYGKSSDVWALGCVLYHMATLTTPFDANDLKGLARKVVQAKAPPRIRTNFRYSTDLTNLAAKLLAKEPNQRPTIGQILASPAIVKRMGLLDSVVAASNATAAASAAAAKKSNVFSDQKSADDKPNFSLHKTIVVPNNIERLQFQLPASRYNTPPTASSSNPSSVSSRDPARRLAALNQQKQQQQQQQQQSSAAVGPSSAAYLQKLNPPVLNPASKGIANQVSVDNPMINKPYPNPHPSPKRSRQQQQSQHDEKENAHPNTAPAPAAAAAAPQSAASFLPKMRPSAQQIAANAAAAALNQNVRGNNNGQQQQQQQRRSAYDSEEYDRSVVPAMPTVPATPATPSASRYGVIGGALKYHQNQAAAMGSQYTHGGTGVAASLHTGSAAPTPKSTYASQHTAGALAPLLPGRRYHNATGTDDTVTVSAPNSARSGYGNSVLPPVYTRPW